MPGKRKRTTDDKGVLSIDIGGSKVKMLASGDSVPRKIASGKKMQPGKLVEEVQETAADWNYDRISIGYPGRVGPEGPVAEPGNLGPGWVGFDFASAFGCPVRIVNDATMQALGSYDGGRMLFVGLGTGIGSALISEGVVVTLELGDLPYEDETASETLGREGLEALGKKDWRKKVLAWLPYVQKAFLADYVVCGGGNSKYLGKTLPPGVRLGHNLTAFRGGFRLWDIDEVATLHAGEIQKRGPGSKWRLL